MKKIYLSIILVFISLTVYCQNQNIINVQIYYRMSSTPWDLTIDDFESLNQDQNFCKSVTLDGETALSEFISELNNLEDTVFAENENSTRRIIEQNGRGIIVSTYPPIDIMGKIIIRNSNHEDIFYYSLEAIWNSMEDKSYKMNDKFRQMIINLFFSDNGLPNKSVGENN